MKIGILTYHKANNLGAVLQAYALQTKLSELNNGNVEIIDYDNIIFKERINIRGIKSFLKSIYYKQKNNAFCKFRKQNFLLSEYYDNNTINKCNKKYDCIICGSDQVWNLDCSNNDYNYFLKFVDNKLLRFSYAASLGTYNFKDDEIKVIENELKKFKKISIREKDSLSQFENMSLNNDISVICDPVFLLNKEEWRKLYNKRIINKKYILVYLIQDDVNVMNAAKKYAKENKCCIISNKKNFEFILNNSPEKFISWIDNAEAVFTNSFHGTAFSLIFNKKLGADIEMTTGKTNNRINELLKATNNEKCIINENNIFFKTDDKKIDGMKNEGIEFLRDVVKG